MLDNRYSRTAHFIASELDSKPIVVVDVSTQEQDNHIFHVMIYLCHYFGKYWIEYQTNGTAIIRKQG